MSSGLVGLLDAELAVALGADERVEREHAHAEAAGAVCDQLADPPEAEHAERLLVELDAGELRALPPAARQRHVRAAECCAPAPAAAPSCARRRSRRSTRARWRRRSRAWSRRGRRRCRRRRPARPITRSRSALLDQLGRHLRGRADQDAVVLADPLGQLLVVPVDARDRRRSAPAAAPRPSRRSSP